MSLSTNTEQLQTILNAVEQLPVIGVSGGLTGTTIDGVYTIDGSAKQNKFVGSEEQFIGFNSNGEAIAKSTVSKIAFDGNGLINSNNNLIIGAGTTYAQTLQNSLSNDAYGLHLIGEDSVKIYFNNNSTPTITFSSNGNLNGVTSITGDVIRYSETEPTTNLIEGQIWLKPVVE